MNNLNNEKKYSFSLTKTALSELAYFESVTIDEDSPPNKIILADILLNAKKNEFEVPEKCLKYLSSALESTIDILKGHGSQPIALKSLQKLSFEVVLLNNQIKLRQSALADIENQAFEKNSHIKIQGNLDLEKSMLTDSVKKVLNMDSKPANKNKI